MGYCIIVKEVYNNERIFLGLLNYMSAFSLTSKGPYIWGPYRFSSFTHFRYFFYFLSDSSYITWMYLLKERQIVSCRIEHVIKK